MVSASKRFAVSSLVAVSLVLWGAACVRDGGNNNTEESCEDGCTSVGSEGGTVRVGSDAMVAELEIPPGALESSVAISMSEVKNATVEGYEILGSRYDFGPEGLEFAKPVRVRLPATNSPVGAAIFWTRKDGPGFERLPTMIEEGYAIAEVSHFSSGFLALPESVVYENVSVESFQQEYTALTSQLACRRTFECPARAASAGRGTALSLSKYADVETCSLDPIAQALGALRSNTVSNVGSIYTFDADVAARCLTELSAYNATPCEDSDLPESCNQVFVGALGVGQACDRSRGECARGLNCETEDRCGTCQPEMCEGVACGLDESCQWSTDANQRVCVTKLKEGDTCSNLTTTDCTLESDDVECNILIGESEGTCTAFYSLAEGEACTADWVCMKGLECPRDSGTENGACTPIAQPEPKPLGEIASKGEACNLSELLFCGRGLACQGFSAELGIDGGGTCDIPREEGVECMVGFECAPGLECVGSGLYAGDATLLGKCTPPLGIGETCITLLDCESRSCSEDVCVERTQPPRVCE